jgi:hypothetical protein
VVALTEIAYELDWQKLLLIGPESQVHLPHNGITTALYLDGLRSAIESDKLADPNSYAHKRMVILAPIPFIDILAIRPTSQDGAVRATRALITIQSEVEPTKVGEGATVVVLPSTGNGTIMEYQNPVTVGETKDRMKRK